MDPNETRRAARAAHSRARELHAAGDRRAAAAWAFEALEHYESLDQWLRQGGFPPDAWRDGPDQHAEHVAVIPDSRDRLSAVD